MIYLFLADGFEEIEALTPVDILRRSGKDITTVGVSGKTVTGAHGITVTADVTINGVSPDPDNVDMLILPGGMPGTKNLGSCEKLNSLLRNAFSAGKYIAAICAAPSIPGQLGLLEGKRATCYPGFEKYLSGAVCTEDRVVVDGNMITSRGMGTALDFALTLVSLLDSKEEADRISSSVIYDR